MNTKFITIDDFLKCVKFQINDGRKFEYPCYSDNAFYMEYRNDKHSVAVIHDIETQLVYAFEVWDYTNDRAYYWIHPDFIVGARAYFTDNKTGSGAPTGNMNIIQLEVAEDILDKATAIVRDQKYDTRITVSLTLSDADMLVLMTAAHEADITLNKFVEQILQDTIDAANR